MTKRTLYIIIGLLLLLDIAAILIYLAGNTNRDGKSAIDFTRDESTPVVIADTIPDRLSEDRFDTIARNGNFVSEQMVLDDDKEKRMTCTVQFKVVWPQSINGKNKLKDLEESIIKTMLGKNYNSINEAITSTIENPEFTKPSSKFISVDKSMATLEHITACSSTEHSPILGPISCWNMLYLSKNMTATTCIVA